MKKIITAIILAALVLSLCACGGKTSGGDSKVNDMALTDIIDAIYEKKAMEFPVMSFDVDVADADSVNYYTGLSSADGIKEAIASESAMGSQAYSLVLVRLNDASKAPEVAKAMKDGINTAKWICVQADDLQVVASGNVVMLIMTDSRLASSSDIVDAFKGIAGSLSVE